MMKNVQMKTVTQAAANPRARDENLGGLRLDKNDMA
jgi:hypothetical protein